MKIKNYINKTHFCKYRFKDNDYQGEMKLKGNDSFLRVWPGSEVIDELDQNYPEQMHGSLNDFTKVTFLDLVNFGKGGNSKQLPNGEYEGNYYHQLYPHTVVFGDRHFEKEELCFESLEFVTSYSTILFNNRISFKQVLHAEKDVIEDLLAEDYEKSKALLGDPFPPFEKPEIGDHPQISIDTGLYEICAFDSPLGRIKIQNSPTVYGMGSHGYKTENKVTCTIEFSEKLNFEHADKKLRPLVSFFELIMGEKLQVLEYRLYAPSMKDYPDSFDVYRCIKNTKKKGKTPHPSERLIRVEEETNEFASVVNKWLIRQDEWQDARWQFFSSFKKNKYDQDRLIKVANMFDLIPDSAYVDEVQLSIEVQNAKAKCREIFKELPDSSERSSILGALGRLGSKTLKNKIRTRITIIKNVASINLPDIEFITDHSVDCRNHFVHGGKRKFDYYENIDMVIFFIRTLEFVFGVSELIEAGWDFETWNDNPHLSGHPFNFYLENYIRHYLELQSIVKAS